MLDGKVAIVTGAGRGIGRAHALALAQEGARVVVNDIGVAEDGAGSDRGPADEVVATIEADGGKAIANNDDISSWEGSGRLVAAAVDAFGDLHVLVNNAGVLRDKMSFNMDEADFDLVVGSHLKGTLATCRHAGALWRERSKSDGVQPRAIVNTASEAGLFGNPGQAHYSAAKGGIIAMTFVLARELARYGATANVVCPRARTRLTEPIIGPAQPDAEGFDPLDPANISPTVVWLASEAARHVTGQVFVLTGGEIHLMRRWEPVNSLRKDTRWSPSELAAEAEKLFAGVPTELPANVIVEA